MLEMQNYDTVQELQRNANCEQHNLRKIQVFNATKKPIFEETKSTKSIQLSPSLSLPTQMFHCTIGERFNVFACTVEFFFSHQLCD
jgi:hypothetical protein